MRFSGSRKNSVELS